jgi:hydrogenase nickel incorporation protein HypA/HybF
MHEYGLVQGILDRVRQEVAARGATRVHCVRVSLGELAGVDGVLLARAWDTFRERTVCEGAALELRTVAARWECTRCGQTLSRGAPLRCPDCGAPGRLAEGEDLVLERIEMEIH